PPNHCRHGCAAPSASRVFLKVLLQNLAKLVARPMQATPHGSYRQVEHFGNGVIITALEFPQNQYRAVLLAQASEGRTNLRDPLFAFHSSTHRWFGGCWFIAATFPALLDGKLGPLPAAMAHCQIERNSIKPSVESTCTLKGGQFYERLHECVLNDVLRVRSRPGDMDQRGIQAVLVPQHQNPEGLAVARQRRIDQLEVVFHNCSEIFDAR